MSSPILSLRSVEKTFTPKDAAPLTVLRSVDFSLLEGESVVISGASGSGKSTLLQIIGGLDVPSKGEVHWQDKSLSTLSGRRRDYCRGAFMGFVYQFHHLLSEFTVLENVSMPLRINGMHPKKAYAEAEVMLVLLGLEKVLRHKPPKLSGGERQRVAVARALVHKPKCVLADEPTGSLDEENAMAVMQAMLSLQKERNTSLVCVTHNPLFLPLFDRSLLLSSGKLDLKVGS